MFFHEVMAGRLMSPVFLPCCSTSFAMYPPPWQPMRSLQQHSTSVQTILHFQGSWPTFWRCGQPFPQLVTAAVSDTPWPCLWPMFPCLETTLWLNCGVFVEEGWCRDRFLHLTLEASCSFWPDVQKVRRLGVCKEAGEGEQGLQTHCHTHIPSRQLF